MRRKQKNKVEFVEKPKDFKGITKISPIEGKDNFFKMFWRKLKTTFMVWFSKQPLLFVLKQGNKFWNWEKNEKWNLEWRLVPIEKQPSDDYYYVGQFYSADPKLSKKLKNTTWVHNPWSADISRITKSYSPKKAK